MNFHSQKFLSRIRRVLFLTGILFGAGFYVHVIQMATIFMTLDIANSKYNFEKNLALSMAEVFVASLILTVIEVFYFTDRFRRKPFVYSVLFKMVFYVTALTIITFIISLMESFHSQDFADYLLENFPVTALLTLFVWGPVFFICITLIQIIDRYGQSVFWKYILGKYHTPKIEERIFMFLDMKSSTTIAELLGNVKYFELLNDFFYDVTDAIIETKGEIYQYVGDEIVITWTMKNGVENANCARCFFDIYEIVHKFSDKYQSKYGLIPSFKAGVHYGEVSIGEIGVIKRDITFSGDVLNTTSRIQELCNKYNEKLIVSGQLADILELGKKYCIREIGKMNLRGRSEPVILFAVKDK